MNRLPILLISWLISWLAVGCTGGGLPMSPDGAIEDSRPCGLGPESVVPDEGQLHVPFGTPVMYRHNPPASGPHWPSPHAWGAYNGTIPREWWVHNLEHGGIVLLYNCPGVQPATVDLAAPADGASLDVDGGSTDAGSPADGSLDGATAWPCPEVTSTLRALRDERQPDRFNTVRVLITADPQAPKRVTAVAWGWVYASDVVDREKLRCFIDARHDRAPESAP